MAKGHDSAGAPTGAQAPTETPERWSAVRKTDVVLRLVKGEAIDAVSRDTQLPAHELEKWRRVFLESGTHGLKKRIDPEDRELRRVQAKLGEVMMRLELAEDLIEKKGYGAELRKHGRAPRGYVAMSTGGDAWGRGVRDTLCGSRGSPDRVSLCHTLGPILNLATTGRHGLRVKGHEQACRPRRQA